MCNTTSTLLRYVLRIKWQLCNKISLEIEMVLSVSCIVLCVCKIWGRPHQLWLLSVVLTLNAYVQVLSLCNWCSLAKEPIDSAVTQWCIWTLKIGKIIVK